MLRVIPLGGLGEIGLNSMVFECRDEMLLVDAGLMFPTPEMPGVEIVVPDFTYLRENAARMKGVVLTHGHEDHLGALPYLLREIPLPVYATKLTLGLLRHKLDELGIHADLREISPRERFAVGNHFDVQPARVAHSVPDGVALVLRTPDGNAVHTGDWKLDPTPLDGLGTDIELLGQAGEEGVACLFSDSTNSEEPGESVSERVVAETFERLFASAPGRVVISLFASNLGRIQHLFDLCERTQRKVALVGRSMQRNVDIARELGFLRVPSHLIIDSDDVGMFPPRFVCVLVTGSQAEPRSGLVQMTGPDFPIQVERGDTVILSARAIPGNERPITALIDRLLARGATVFHGGREPGVHVSGHAHQADQRRMIEVVKPRCFVPIHGELHHLHAHLNTARGFGLEADRTLLARDGDVIAWDGERAILNGSVAHGRVFQDRTGGGIVDEEALRERMGLGTAGVVAVVVAIDRSNNALVSGPTLHGRGLSADEQAFLPRATAECRTLFLEMSAALRGDDAAVREELTRAVRRVFKQYLGRRPTVMPLIVKL